MRSKTYQKSSWCGHWSDSFHKIRLLIYVETLKPSTTSTSTKLHSHAFNKCPYQGFHTLAFTLVTLIASIWLPDVLERQALSFNLLSKLVLSLILENHFVGLPTQQAKSDIIQKGIFFSPYSDYTYFSEDVMIRSSQPVKIPGIRVFFKIISGHQFWNRNSGHVQKIPDVWHPSLLYKLS